MKQMCPNWTLWEMVPRGTILNSTHLISVASINQSRCEVNRTTDTRIFSKLRDRFFN